MVKARTFCVRDCAVVDMTVFMCVKVCVSLFMIKPEIEFRCDVLYACR